MSALNCLLELTSATRSMPPERKAGVEQELEVTGMRFHLGPYVRHWVTRNLALGASVGLRYDYFKVAQPTGNVATTETTMQMFSSLQVVTAF